MSPPAHILFSVSSLRSVHDPDVNTFVSAVLDYLSSLGDEEEAWTETFFSFYNWQLIWNSAFQMARQMWHSRFCSSYMCSGSISQGRINDNMWSGRCKKERTREEDERFFSKFRTAEWNLMNLKCKILDATMRDEMREFCNREFNDGSITSRVTGPAWRRWLMLGYVL